MDLQLRKKIILKKIQEEDLKQRNKKSEYDKIVAELLKQEEKQ